MTKEEKRFLEYFWWYTLMMGCLCWFLWGVAGILYATQGALHEKFQNMLFSAHVFLGLYFIPTIGASIGIPLKYSVSWIYQWHQARAKRKHEQHQAMLRHIAVRFNLK